MKECEIGILSEKYSQLQLFPLAFSKSSSSSRMLAFLLASAACLSLAWTIDSIHRWHFLSISWNDKVHWVQSATCSHFLLFFCKNSNGTRALAESWWPMSWREFITLSLKLRHNTVPSQVSPSLSSYLISNGCYVSHALWVGRELVYLFHQVTHHFHMTLQNKFQGQHLLSDQLPLACWEIFQSQDPLLNIYLQLLKAWSSQHFFWDLSHLLN